MIDCISILRCITKFCEDKSNSLMYENNTRGLFAKDVSIYDVRKSLEQLYNLTGEIVYKSTVK